MALTTIPAAGSKLRGGTLNSLITEVRGRGLMIAVDLAEPVAGRIKATCAERGLLVITVGDSMLRLLPPLVLTEEQADRGLRLLGEVIGTM